MIKDREWLRISMNESLDGELGSIASQGEGEPMEMAIKVHFTKQQTIMRLIETSNASHILVVINVLPDTKFEVAFLRALHLQHQ